MQYFTLSFDYPGRKSEWRMIINLTPFCSLVVQPSQPLSGIFKLSYSRISILPEGEEFLLLLFFLIDRKVHLTQQVLEARVGAQGRELHECIDIGHDRIAHLETFLEPFEGLVIFPGYRIQ
jgi:hypothetical protein